jgi:hypothetical protein
MADPTLQAALNFTDDDLIANREGRLSPGQQERLSATQSRGRAVNWVSGAVFLVILILIATYVLPLYSAAAAAGSSSAVPLPIIGAVIVVVVGIIGFSIARTRRRLGGLTGTVLMTEGEASGRQGLVPMAGNAMAPVFRLSIGKVTFPLTTPEPMTAFTTGHRYRAYYVNGTRPTLVSAEPV